MKWITVKLQCGYKQGVDKPKELAYNETRKGNAEEEYPVLDMQREGGRCKPSVPAGEGGFCALPPNYRVRGGGTSRYRRNEVSPNWGNSGGTADLIRPEPDWLRAFF